MIAYILLMPSLNLETSMHFLDPSTVCSPLSSLSVTIARERERELRKEGRVVPSRVKLREGPINVTELHWAKPTMGLR
jgi:predicted nuclease with RNAse H fold